VSYLLLKSLHVTTVAITLVLFLWRWRYVLRHDPARRPRWMRWVPHLNDSLLFLFGLALAWRLGLSPGGAGWLAAKLLALLVYIALGLYVMRFAPSSRARFFGGAAALLVFGYIVGVALTKNALWFAG